MPKISTRVSFDKVAAAARIRAAANEALTVMGNQALKDVTQYVPRDQETLQNSGLSGSDQQAENLKFEMRWNTPYAQYLWHGDVMHGSPTSRSYGPEKLSFTSALAREEWARYARQVHGENWKAVYQAALKEELRNDTGN